MARNGRHYFPFARLSLLQFPLQFCLRSQLHRTLLSCSISRHAMSRVDFHNVPSARRAPV
jgi:hypothetical protein